jgi:hypothetical protein
MPAWRIMLGGLLVWAAHFFALYVLASVFGSSIAARVGTAAATLVAVAANVFILRVVWRSADGDAFGRWTASLGALGAGLSLVAVLWQAMPALVG